MTTASNNGNSGNDQDGALSHLRIIEYGDIPASYSASVPVSRIRSINRSPSSQGCESTLHVHVAAV